MPTKTDAPSLETLRDLLGLARALYATWRKSGQGPIEMEELRSIGEDLREAYQLAQKARPGSQAHRAAWGKAERATARFGDIVGKYETVQNLVSKTGERLGFRNVNDRPFLDRNEKFRERVKRG